MIVVRFTLPYRPVILESPYAGNVARNLRYLNACIADSLGRFEAPFASHLMYTGALDDADPSQRERGIKAGLVWGSLAEWTVVYEDLGISSGMQIGIAHAEAAGRPVEFRRIGFDWVSGLEDE